MIHELASIIVAGSAVYHLVMGVSCVAGVSFIASATRFLYRLELPERLDPRLEYSIRPLGAFAIWTGLVCLLSFTHRDESWSEWIKIFLAVLFLLRAAFRFFGRQLFFQAFSVPWERSRWNVALNIFLSVLLLVSAVGRLWF